MSYAHSSGYFEYIEYEVGDGVRKGSFKMRDSVIYPSIEERIGEIQANLSTVVGFLELKIVVVAEDMPLKEQYILVSTSDLMRIQPRHHQDSDLFKELPLLTEKEYRENIPEKASYTSSSRRL